MPIFKKKLPTPRIELGTFRLQGERINHFAKQATAQIVITEIIIDFISFLVFVSVVNDY